MSSGDERIDQSSEVSQEEPHQASSAERPVCFVLMPISDPPDYAPGHFERVFKDIFEPACNKAGFDAIRASDVRQANLIHLDILQKLLESPMALCDLSSRNPNVLFELGLRQAFDKPVVLVREIGTQDIFDIVPLRYAEYRSERLYHEVLEDQRNIADTILETQAGVDSGQGVNSIVKLLSITQAATLIDVQDVDKDPILQVVRAELSELRTEFREALDITRSMSARVARPSSTPTTSASSNERRTRRDVDILLHRIEEIQEGLVHIQQGNEEPNGFEDMIRTTKVRSKMARRRAEHPVTVEKLDAINNEIAHLHSLYMTMQNDRMGNSDSIDF